MECLGRLGICLELSLRGCEIEQETESSVRGTVCQCQFCHSTGREGSDLPSKECWE